MEYSLAKELKDAGFPQKSPFPLSDKSRTELKERGLDPDMHFPTLEELIEACGDRFLFLDRRKDHPSYIPVGWRAQEVGTGNGIAEGNGATPEEAVARLYLALNKKA